MERAASAEHHFVNYLLERYSSSNLAKILEINRDTVWRIKTGRTKRATRLVFNKLIVLWCKELLTEKESSHERLH